MDKEVAPVTPQDKVEDCPEVIVLGEAEKEVMVGAEGAGVIVNAALVTLESVIPAFIAIALTVAEVLTWKGATY
jgi:hypothetical protein